MYAIKLIKARHELYALAATQLDMGKLIPLDRIDKKLRAQFYVIHTGKTWLRKNAVSQDHIHRQVIYQNGRYRRTQDYAQNNPAAISCISNDKSMPACKS